MSFFISNNRNLHRELIRLNNILERPPNHIKNYLKKHRIDLATINLDVNPLTKAIQFNVPIEKIHALLKNFSTINNKKVITELDIEQLKRKIELNKKFINAIKNEDIKQIQHLLIEDNIDLNLFKSDDNPLIYSLKNNKSKKIIELLLQHYINVNFHQFNGNTPLTEAVILNNKSAFNLLLKNGANVNFINGDEETSFLYLIKNKLMTKYYLSNFLEHNADFNLQDGEGKSTLMYLVENNELHLLNFLLSTLIFNNSCIINLIIYGKNKIEISNKKLKELIENEYSKINIDIEDDMGYTSLMYASREGNFELASILLTYKANVNKENLNKNTPLLLACENDYTHTAKLLLQTNQVQMNHQNRNGDTELTLAAQNNNPEIIHLLLDYHSDINIKNDKSYTPLHVATYYDRIYAVRALLEHHADVNLEDMDGNTPLILACQNQNPLIMEMLLEYHSDINHKNKLGCIGLHYVKSKEMVRILLNYKVNINERNNKGDTLVNILCYPKNKKNKKIKETLTYILDHQGDINNVNYDGENALIIACKNGNLEIVDLLLSRSINYNHVKSDGDSALIIACMQQNLEIVNRLLNVEGIQIDTVNNEGDSPFLIACRNNNIPIINTLLKYNKNNSINFNIKNLKDEFPLYFAVYFHNAELIKFLLKEQVNIYEENSYSRFNPFLLVCSSLGKEKDIKLFIDYGVDINRPNSIGLYPLIQACKSSKINGIRILLQNGANPNVVCDYSTPLIDACMLNNIEVVKELLKYGADVNLKSNNDMTALIHLINEDQVQNNHIVKLLIDYGANIFEKDNYGNSLLYILKNSNKIDKEEVYETIIKAMKHYKNTEHHKFDDHNHRDDDITKFIETYDDYITVMASLQSNDDDNINEFSKTQLEHAFLQACIFSNTYYAELILKKCPEINVNLRETNGDTPLIIASQLGNSYLIDVLLRYNADTTIISECHNTALFVAIYYYHRHNDLSIIRSLLEHGSNPNEICQYSHTALMMACKNELLEVVSLLLDYHADPNISNNEGHTALSIACMYGNHQIVNLLLDTKNVDINHQNNHGDTPLMIACENGFGSIVSLLLQYNANIYVKNQYHQTALHIACNKELNPIIIQFLEYKKKLDFLDEDDFFLSPYQTLKLSGNTIFLSIVMDYEISYLKELINNYNNEMTISIESTLFSEKYNCDLNNDKDNIIEKEEEKKEKEKEEEKEKEKEKEKINNIKKFKNLCHKDIITSLNKKLSIIENQKECLTEYKQIIIGEYSHKMNTFPIERLHEYFIYSTIFLNTDFIFKFLELTKYNNVNDKEENANANANANANENENEKDEKDEKEKEKDEKENELLLLSQKININYQDSDGNTALHYICSHKSQKKNLIISIIKLFIQHHADINIPNHNGFTPLMYACQNNNKDVVKLLINHQADINAINHNHQTAIMLACLEPCQETINILIENGADLDIQDTIHQDTVLTMACKYYQHSNIIKDLIIRGKANINLANAEGNTPLILTCQNDIFNISKLLIDYGADVNAQNKLDHTSPLLITINNCNYSLMKYLLDHQADINIMNSKGETPLIAACKTNNKYIAEYLLTREPNKEIKDIEGHTAKDIIDMNNYHFINNL